MFSALLHVFLCLAQSAFTEARNDPADDEEARDDPADDEESLPRKRFRRNTSSSLCCMLNKSGSLCCLTVRFESVGSRRSCPLRLLNLVIILPPGPTGKKEKKSRNGDSSMDPSAAPFEPVTARALVGKKKNAAHGPAKEILFFCCVLSKLGGFRSVAGTPPPAPPPPNMPHSGRCLRGHTCTEYSLTRTDRGGATPQSPLPGLRTELCRSLSAD